MIIRRYSALAIWLACVAICVFVISHSTFNADMSAFLPRSPTPNQKIMVEQLSDGVVSRLILVGVDGAPVAKLAQISKSMAAQLRVLPELTSVNNGEQAGVEKDYQLLWRYRYFLSDAVTPQRFTAEGLHDRLSMYLDLLNTPMSAMAQRVLPKDPSGELIHLLEQLDNAARPAMLDDVWFSRDGRRAMLMVQIKGAGSDIDAQESAMQHIESAFKVAKTQSGVTGAHLKMTGPGVFSVQSRASIQDDAWRLSLIATLLIASMLLLLYRSIRVLIVGLLPVLTGALAGVAAVSIGFGSVHGITLAFGVTLIGECVDYAIYLFTQIEQNSTPKTTLQRIWPTLRLGMLTSISGFSAMLFSGFTGLAQLGLFSIAGLLAAASVTRWVLPPLLPAGFSVRRFSYFSRAVMILVRHAPRVRIVMLALLAILLALLISKRDELWNDNLSSMSPVSKELLVLDQQLRSDMGVPDVRYMLVLQAASQESVLRQGEMVASILRKQVKQGWLASFDVPPLPSNSLQLSRQQALPEAAILSVNLDQALRDLPYRESTFSTFMQEIEQAKQLAPLDKNALQGSNLGLKLDSILLKNNAGWMLILPLHVVSDAARIEQGIRLATQAPFVLLDMSREAEQMLHDYRRQAIQYAVFGVLAIFALLLFSLRSVRRVFDVSLPLIASVIVVATCLVLTGNKLSIFHLVGLLLVVAVGSNYALFFDHGGVSQHQRERTVTSIVFANASTVIGFGLLSFSTSPVLNSIGSTVSLGAFLCLIFSAIFIVRREH